MVDSDKMRDQRNFDDLPRSSHKAHAMTPLHHNFIARCGIYNSIRDIWGLDKLLLSHVPCGNPRSLMRQELPGIAAAEYHVGLKTDGVRMFLYMGHYVSDDGARTNYAVCIDRAFRIYTVNVTTRDVSHYNGSLFDGELLRCDTTIGNDSTIGNRSNSTGMRFVFFDAVYVSGHDVKQSPFSARMAALRASLNQIHMSFDGVAVHVLVKQWTAYPHCHLAVWSAAVRERSCDGIIFVKENGPVQAGTQPDMFKWKPASHHTIDFMWDLKRRKLVLCDNNGDYVSASRIGVTVEAEWSTRLTMHKVVVECMMARTGEDTWTARPVCVRDDKKKPNNINIAVLTLRNISENVELAEIFPCTK